MQPVNEHTLPAVHVAHLLDLVKRWNVHPGELLESAGIPAETLGDPHARLPLSTIEKLVTRARLLTGEPGLGVYLGLAMQISWHGYLGFAAMTAGTMGDAIELATRFVPTRTTALALRLHTEGKRASLVIEELAPLGASQDVLVLALIIGLSEIGRTLTGRELAGSVDFAFPEPPWFARFTQVFRGPVRFGQPAHQWVFDADQLSLPLKMADAAALRLATEQCERELAALGTHTRISARTRALLGRTHSGFPSIDEVAQALHVSPRTLKRKLAAEGTSYSELLEALRRERALLLLRADELSLDQVAERLGYADAPTFNRAFTRWTGTSPASFRRAGGRVPLEKKAHAGEE